MNYYQKQIAKHTKENPVHVEAWMRSEHGTLDAMSATDFANEARAAAQNVRESGPEMSQRLADSMGIK